MNGLRNSTGALLSLTLLLFLAAMSASAQSRSAVRGTGANFDLGRTDTAPIRRLAHRKTNTSVDGLAGSAQPILVGQWDNTAEDGYRSPFAGTDIEFLQLLTMPEDGGVINEVTACFFFDQPVVDFTYEVLVFRNSGGAPGSIVDSIELVASGTVEDNVCLVGAVDIPVSQARTFVGIVLPDVGDTFLGVDTNGPFTSPGFYRIPPTSAWTQMPDAEFTNYRNLAIEVEFTAGGTAPPQTCAVEACVEDDETLCLGGDRFKLTAGFADISGASGPMKTGPEITPDTGFFHFPGTPDNVEVVVKVLDACVAPFDRFWVFASGLTDQEITLTVCDTVAGEQVSYFNPLSSPFAPITDTDAFATCP